MSSKQPKSKNEYYLLNKDRINEQSLKSYYRNKFKRLEYFKQYNTQYYLHKNKRNWKNIIEDDDELKFKIKIEYKKHIVEI
jgi:hypothetical protein